MLLEADDRPPLTVQIVRARMAAGRPVYASSPARSRAGRPAPQAARRPTFKPFTPAQLAHTATGASAMHGLDARVLAAVVRPVAPAPAARRRVGLSFVGPIAPEAPRFFSLVGGAPSAVLSGTEDEAPVGMVDPSTGGALVLQAQMMLANWRSAYGAACDPPDFGVTPADLSGVTLGGPKDRTARALASFARWSNASFPALPPLTPNGQLDHATYERLHGVNDAINAQRSHGNLTDQGAAKPGAPAAASGHSWLLPAAAAATGVYLFRRELARMLGVK